MKTHFSPDDESVISSQRFKRSQAEPSDADISLLSDKLFKPGYFDLDDNDFKSGDCPSTSSSTRSRSDRTPSEFKQSTHNSPKKDMKNDTKDKGVLFRLTLAERARSFILHTTD